MKFRGVNDKAPISAEGEQEILAGVAGKNVSLRFQRLQNSSTPMLLSVGQLRELDCVLYLREGYADIRSLDRYRVPLNVTSKGHLTISLADWSAKPSSSTPRYQSDEVDIWRAEVEESASGIVPRSTHRLLERWQKEVDESLDAALSVVESLRADAWNDSDFGSIVAELYCGAMEVTSCAVNRSLPVSRPRDILLGDDLLDML